jgi:hypothetical protein
MLQDAALTVPKDRMFKLRLDAKDRERLDAVAAHYSASAATVIRILVKEKFDAIRRKEAQTEAATHSTPPPKPAKPSRKR